jgi:DsbC/DsbD-like thiol-disulfide interchange protein
MQSNASTILALMFGGSIGWSMPWDTNKIEVPDPKPQQPVTAAIKVLSDKRTNVVAHGEHLVVFVRMRIFPSFHIYGLNKSGTENTPTRLKLTLPNGLKTKLDWTAPEPINKGKARIYEQEVTFTNTLALNNKVALGKHTIKCELEYQVCDEELCWPPAKLDLAADIEVLPSN